MEDEKSKAEQSRKALEIARHELTTLHGLIAADGAAPTETWTIDTNRVVAAIDEVLSESPSGIRHWSSCAMHNEPAYPAGPCDCGALAKAERRYAVWLGQSVYNLVAGLRNRLMSWLWISFHPGVEASNLRAILKRYPRRSDSSGV
jgi:hypothetical protein